MDKQIEQSQWSALTGNSADGAFSDIYEQTSRAVWTLCFRILKSEEDASDALQGTYARLLQLVQSEPQPPGEHSMESLMLRLAVLEADRIRKQRSRRQQKEVAVENMEHIEQRTPSLKDQLARQQLREKFTELIEELPENLRLPLTLHYLDGMTQTQISSALGVSQSAINQRLKRALDVLRPKCHKAGLKELSTVLATLAATQVLLTPPKALVAKTVFTAATQLSQSAGFASLSLSALMPAKGAVLGGKALLATVASIVVIVAITLATAVGGEKKEQTAVNDTSKVPQTIQKDQGGNDKNNSTIQTGTKTADLKAGSPGSDQEQTDEPVFTADIDPTMKVLWQGTDEPVEGASLLLIDSETTETSNTEGIIPLDSLLKDGRTEEGRKIRLSHPRGATKTLRIPINWETPTIFQMKKAKTVSGIVAFAEGGKLADNEPVSFFQNIRAFDENITVEGTNTDDKGRYEFYITDPGKCRIRVINDVYIDWVEHNNKHLEMNLAGDMDVEAPMILLEKPSSIYGRITDERGNGIADATIHDEKSYDILGTSDINGDYTLSPLVPKLHTLVIKHPEYVPKAYAMDVGRNENKRLPMTLEEGFKAKVTALAKENELPVPGLTVGREGLGYTPRYLPLEQLGQPGEYLLTGLSKIKVNSLKGTSKIPEFDANLIPSH